MSNVITLTSPQLLQPTAPGGTPDVAPPGAPQTQYELDADAPEILQQAVAALADFTWNKGNAAKYSPLPPAGVKVGDVWHPATTLLP